MEKKIQKIALAILLGTSFQSFAMDPDMFGPYEGEGRAAGQASPRGQDITAEQEDLTSNISTVVGQLELAKIVGQSVEGPLALAKTAEKLASQGDLRTAGALFASPLLAPWVSGKPQPSFGQMEMTIADKTAQIARDLERQATAAANPQDAAALRQRAKEMEGIAAAQRQTARNLATSDAVNDINQRLAARLAERAAAQPFSWQQQRATPTNPLARFSNQPNFGQQPQNPWRR